MTFVNVCYVLLETRRTRLAFLAFVRPLLAVRAELLLMRTMGAFAFTSTVCMHLTLLSFIVSRSLACLTWPAH